MNPTAFTSFSRASRLDAQRDKLLTRSKDLLKDMERLVIENYDFETAGHVLNRLEDVGEMRKFLTELSEGDEESATKPTFVIGSESLYTAFHNLCRIPTESIIYAVGSRFGDFYTIERLVPLKLDKSEVGYASADLASSSRVLIDLEPYGTLLTAYFHAHPGSGPGANHPSGIDIGNHARLEQGDYKTVGGIFSRDGYLRFFSDKMNFNIAIAGKGVEHVHPNLWRLTQADGRTVRQS